MTTTATMETVLTDEQQTLLNRFYHACDAARRFSRDEYHLAVNVTRLWNWIDADGLPLEHGLTEVLWHCLAEEFPECFREADSPNSINFAYWKPATIQMNPARHSAGVVLQSKSSGTGFKTDAHYLIEASGARWVNRSRGYITSESNAAVLQWAEVMGFKAHMIWSHRTAAEQQVYYLPWLGDHPELRFCFRQLKTLHSLALKRVPMCADLLKIVSAEMVRDAATGKLKARPDIRGLRKQFEPIDAKAIAKRKTHYVIVQRSCGERLEAVARWSKPLGFILSHDQDGMERKHSVSVDQIATWYRTHQPIRIKG